MKLFVYCLVVIVSPISVFSQRLPSIRDTQQNSYIKVTAESRITEKGARGSVQITNISSRLIYVNSAGATAQVLKVNQSTGKSVWVSQSFYLKDVFIDPNVSISDNKSGLDTKGGFSYEDTKNLKIEFGNIKVVSKYDVPDKKCFKINTTGVTKLFSVDGINYSAQVVKNTTDGLIGNRVYENSPEYKVEVLAENTTTADLRLTAPVRYKIYWNGLATDGEASLKKIRGGKTETENAGTVRATSAPSIYLEITYLPAVEGVSSGDRTSEVPAKMYTKTEKPVTQSPASAGGGTTSTNNQNLSTTSGTLLLTSDIQVSIRIDGEQRGDLNAAAPFKLQLAPGEHLLDIIPAADPSKIISEVVAISAQNQTVKQIKLRAQFGVLEDRRIANEKLTAQKEEAKRQAEEKAKQYELEIAKKRIENEQAKILNKFPRTFVQTDIWKLDTKEPKEVLFDKSKISFDSNNDIIIDGKKYFFWGDSMRSIDGVKFYELDFYRKLKQERMNVFLRGEFKNKRKDVDGERNYYINYNYCEGCQDYELFEFYQDGSGIYFTSESRRIGGPKQYRFNINWVMDGNVITFNPAHLAMDNNPWKIQVLDFIPNHSMLIIFRDTRKVLKMKKAE